MFRSGFEPLGWDRTHRDSKPRVSASVEVWAVAAQASRADWSSRRACALPSGVGLAAGGDRGADGVMRHVRRVGANTAGFEDLDTPSGGDRRGAMATARRGLDTHGWIASHSLMDAARGLEKLLLSQHRAETGQGSPGRPPTGAANGRHVASSRAGAAATSAAAGFASSSPATARSIEVGGHGGTWVCQGVLS